MCCPRPLARSTPSAVLMRIRSRSTSAKPPKTSSIRRPVLVSAHASASERNCARNDQLSAILLQASSPARRDGGPPRKAWDLRHQAQAGLLPRCHRDHRILRSGPSPCRFRRRSRAGRSTRRSCRGFLSVRLEHQPLAGAPAAGIHHRMEPLGEFVLVVMRVEVEVAPRPAHGAEEFAQVFGVRVALDHRRDHARSPADQNRHAAGAP